MANAIPKRKIAEKLKKKLEEFPKMESVQLADVKT